MKPCWTDERRLKVTGCVSSTGGSGDISRVGSTAARGGRIIHMTSSIWFK